MAASRSLPAFSFEALLDGRSVLHFAPERVLGDVMRRRAARYRTADFLRPDCDLRVDMCAMPEVDDGSLDVAVAFDVLEHVPDYRKALAELHRVLAPGGFAILTVPQQDGLVETREDPSITTPEARTLHYGQSDHLRMFGNDFSASVERGGFQVTEVDEGSFPPELRAAHVLKPPMPSPHPLATNFRKVFYARKPGR